MSEADIQDEIEFWNSSIICYVLGANPPIYVIDGFIRRIWKNLGVDKVASISKEMFIVRFTSMESRDTILNGGFQFFDKKPLIIKAWALEMDVAKEVLHTVPMWIQLHKMDIKYWGDMSLFEIAGQIGKALKTDQATFKRESLWFARILVEAEINQVFPDQVSFVNEKEDIVRVDVVFE